MKINDLQAKLEHFDPLTENDAAKFLASSGEEVNEKISETFNKYLQEFSSTNPLILAILESSIWAGYAKRIDNFFKMGANFLEKGDEGIFLNLNDFIKRYEAGKLKSLLKSWKKILERIQSNIPPREYSAKDLVALQRKLPEEILKLAGQKGLPQIGAWMLYCPFGVLAISKNSLWKDPELDNLLIPQGQQVIKGRLFLQKLGLKNALLELPESYETDLMSGLNTAFLGHEFEKKLADLSQSRVVHINSGLYLLGGGKEDLYLLPEK